ncbi:MAG: hypothetical protein ACHP8A_11990 [Terriglobales bacterium]
MRKHRADDWQAVAVSPEPVAITTVYMQSHGYSTSQVQQADLSVLGVPGTPTLLLVDRGGRLQKQWVGKLPRDQEEDVAAQLGIDKLL